MLHALGMALAALVPQDVPRPEALDARLEVRLVAAEPDLVTPTSLDVDARGRIWVIESNTHFPPKNYKGHPTDRILVFDDFGPDGRARRRSTFADGFRYGMSLMLRPDGDVFFATRWEILSLRDRDGDGAADERRVLVRLDTKGDYPHNGLCGFALDPEGRLIFGLGENLGVPYTLVGSDGKELTGGGEGGNVYRCRTDGSDLERLATGFWNPFHMTVDAFGRLFVVDNDPDSRPPCRLLYVVPGADFGYRFRNGRRGLHPFTSWNGELPGTLPMVAGTGEAPSGIVAYEAEAFPDDYRGALLVTSWGDHALERYRPEPRGASFSARTEPFVRGGENFRPVGIAVAPDGSLVVSDWVDKSYTLHGKGRIWRIRSREPRPPGLPAGDARGRIRAVRAAPDPAPFLEDADERVRAEAVRRLKGAEDRLREAALRDPSKHVRMHAVLGLRRPESARAVAPLLADEDPYLSAAAVEALSRLAAPDLLRELAADRDPKMRLGALLSMRRRGGPEFRAPDPKFLEDPDPAVRRAAVQWVGEEGLTELREAIAAAAARPPVTRDLFEAFLAAVGFLDARERAAADQAGPEFYLLKVLDAPRQAPELRALALRLLRPDHPRLATDRLKDFLRADAPILRLEAVRILAGRADPESQKLLRTVAGDPSRSEEERRQAIAGLAAAAAPGPEARDLLLSLLDDPRFEEDALATLAAWASDPPVRAAFERLAARGRHAEKIALALGREFPERPRTLEEWRRAASGSGDPARGERVFFHPKGPQCARCHQVNGRGGIVGPDLSIVGSALTRERLLDSILEPSKEVAPMFVLWRVLTRDGRVLDGRLLQEDPSGTLVLIDAQGRTTSIRASEIEERRPSQLSIMPENLQAAMTRQELRDLLAFLESLK
ncbi:MAG TPA: PVC-type heme-binding CxxCH protein [Planctomycetota bacterium]|nr:PVC-type heme-binding CxxCH protein [Planctomycetota bacterium]